MKEKQNALLLIARLVSSTAGYDIRAVSALTA